MHSLKRRSSELLDEARAFHASKSDTDIAIRHFLSALDTPRSLSVWLLFSCREHDQLTALKCDPLDYENDPYGFRLDYWATEFLSKASFLRTSFNRDEVALAKFSEFENLCGETNRRFRNPLLDPLNHGPNVALLHAVQRKIERILGDFSADEFVDGANWGPGVSTLIKGEHVSAINKFHDERGITRDLYSLVGGWIPAAYPLWHDSLSRTFGENYHVMQAGNTIVTVPKNSKTNRVIAIEPGWNLWFQKSLGSMIRRRLLRSGIDLLDQSRNQQLALEGSKTRLLATVDFSSASDSISTEVVRAVLPPRWFQLMDTARSRLGVRDSNVIRWNKFSSMGNGFTFELESLIFFAAASAVSEYLGVSGEISVYGDDVIIPVDSYELFSSFSAYLGFRVNPKKSFSSGYFRESCGSHYYDGVDCKPIFLKEKLRNVEAFYKLANSIRLLAHRRNSYRGCCARFRECWSYLLYRVPESLRLFVPRQAGDTGFVGNLDEANPVRARYGIEGFYYRALTSVGVSHGSESTAVLLARLWSMSTQSAENIQYFKAQGWGYVRPFLPDRAYGNLYDLRGRSKRTITRPLVQLWYNLGSWD